MPVGAAWFPIDGRPPFGCGSDAGSGGTLAPEIIETRRFGEFHHRAKPRFVRRSKRQRLMIDGHRRRQAALDVMEFRLARAATVDFSSQTLGHDFSVILT